MAGAAPFSVVSLGDAEAVPLAEGQQWIPVRRALGISAFGVNAFTAQAAGDVVIEEHVESPGQEEIYVLIAGRARFEIGEETVEAAPGDVVFVSDPEVRRAARALEPGTTAIAVGGWPGEAYRSLPWEAIYLARPAMEAGDWAAVVRILEAEAGDRRDHWIIQYRIACAQAQLRHGDEAYAELEKAIAGNPGLAERAASDPMLAGLDALDAWLEARAAPG